MDMPRILAGTRRGHMLWLLGIGTAQAAAAIATALLVRTAFDGLIVAGTPAPSGLLGWVAGGLLAIAAAGAWLRWRERVEAEGLGQDYTCELRVLLFNHLTRLPPRVLQKRSKGGTLLRFLGDLTALRQWVSLGVARLSVAAVTSAGALLALGWIDWVLALTVAGILALGGILAFRDGWRMEETVRAARRERARLAANVAEKISVMPVVQAFGQRRRERRTLERHSEALRDAMLERAGMTGRLRAITEASAALASGGALLVGALEVAAGQTSPGTVVAAMVVVGLLVPPLRDLGRVHEYWHGARVSRDKIQRFLNAPGRLREVRGAPPLVVTRGCVELDRVSVAGALRDLSAIAEPGQRVAIVGTNGAGKSTLLALTARLLDPDQGRVLVDGQDLTQCNLASVRRCVGVMGPDLPLLRGSIAKNLRYRNPRADAGEVAEITALCGLDEVLGELAQGADTRVTEGASDLSAGQRARIALARALMGHPPILLLDEADANLDCLSGAALDRVLTRYRGTVLLVTHRPERLDGVDRIWHLDAGRLVEVGPPEQLLQTPGATSRLFGQPLRRVS